MPIYEFYCEDCNMLFNFFSPAVDTETRPPCPRCDREELERRPARFATLKRVGSGEEGDEDSPFPDLDEERLEQVMESMAGELEGMDDEEDPRQMAQLFRRFGEAAGMAPGPKLEEMLARLEAGEDPDALEDEMGDDLDEDEALEEWFQLKGKAEAAMAASRRKRARVDDELYFL